MRDEARRLWPARRNGLAWVLSVAILPAAVLAAGTVDAQTVQPFTREQVTPQVPERPGAGVDPGPALTAPTAPDESPPPGGPTFVLNGLTYEGSSVYDAADLDAVLIDRLGRPVDFAGLREITDRIEALYRADGYIAVRAVVPAQRIQDGRVTIRIVEGAISELVVRGDLGRAQPAVERLLGELVGQRPLKAASAERQILLARDLPGVNLATALRAGGSGAAGDLVLLVEGVSTPLDGFASVANFASDFAGPIVFTFGAGANSVALSGDRISIVALTAAEYGEEALVELTYEVPLGVPGLTGRVSASNSISESGAELAPLDLDYRSQILRGEVEYALIRSRARSAYASGGLEIVHQESNANIPALAVDEDLTVLFAGLRYLEPSLVGGRLDMTTELRFGIDALGASSEGDSGLTGGIGADTDPQFFAARAEATFFRPLPAGFALEARMRAQVSTGNLPTFERFSLGNYTIGRGFDPGSATGDHGVAGSLTVNYTPDISALYAGTGPTLFGFVDAGRTFSDNGADLGLVSVGAGLRLQLFDRVDAEAFVAVPVENSDLIDEDDVQGLFRVTAFF